MIAPRVVMQTKNASATAGNLASHRLVTGLGAAGRAGARKTGSGGAVGAATDGGGGAGVVSGTDGAAPPPLLHATRRPLC